MFKSSITILLWFLAKDVILNEVCDRLVLCYIIVSWN